MIPVYVVGGLILLILIWIAATYNSLVRIRNHVQESWSDIDTELKRRYDLIPNLVETVKGYAKHEQETFRLVIEARNRAVASTGSPASQAQDENAFVRTIRQLFAVVEGYPELKANRNFLALQEELANTTVEASSGGEAVKVTMNGQQKIQSVKIAPEVVNPEDVELLEDLVLTAVSEALVKSQEAASEHLGGLTGGLKIPGLT